MSKYVTKQRRVLLDYLTEHADETLSAGQIAQALSDREISVSAVYRNLATLEAEGQIQKVTKSGERRAYFRFSGSDECRKHIHLYCTGCGKTYHVDVPTTDLVADSIASSAGFEVDRSKTVISGICRDCGRAARGGAGSRSAKRKTGEK